MGANETAIDRLKPLELLIAEIERDLNLAQRMAQEHFPFKVQQRAKRKPISRKDQAAIFQRDQYRCRYFGDRLLFPGVLLLLEKLKCFPADENYRIANSHWVYWWFSPVVDHKEAVAAAEGDPNHSDNLVTTSNFRNIQKGPWTLKQMGWKDRGLPSADEAWDGMTGWFRRYMRTAPAEVWNYRNLRKWAAAIGCGCGEDQEPSTRRLRKR